MSVWSTNTTSIGNDQVYVNNTYKDANGKNKLTTITTSNPGGYTFLNRNSSDPIVRDLAFAVQTDGKITYIIAGSNRQYNSIQDIADARISGYTSQTTLQIKNEVQKNLKSAADRYNQANPSTPIGPAIATSTTGDPLTPSTPLTPENISTTIPDSDLSKKTDATLRVNLKYPITLNGSQDTIKFSVKQFLGRQGIENVAGTGFSLGTRKVSEILGSVTLPIQPSISDSNGVDWGGANLNPIQAYAAGLSLNVAAAGGNITGEVARALNQAATEFKDGLNNSGYKEAIQLYFAQEAVGAQNLLSRTSGAILNPNLELLFNGPTLRPFNFTFRLSPRSGPEAEQVKKIINWFKKGMAVKQAASKIFLKAPNVFDIEYKSGSSEHKSLNKIKTCALLGCDVDYTPDGSYMTFNDEAKTMTSYQITLRFSELDPIYNTDYEGLDNEIGF